MKIGMRFDGGDKLARALGQLPARVSKRVVMQALRDAAEPIRAQASAMAPRDPGAPDLADNIGIGVTRGDEGEMAVAIGPTKHFFYGLFQEEGTSRHGAKPFMRPAFDGEAEKALRTMRQSFWDALARRGVSTRSSAGGGGLL